MVVRGLMGWELRGSVFEFWQGKPCVFMVGDEKLAATRAGEIQSVLRMCTEKQVHLMGVHQTPNVFGLAPSSQLQGSRLRQEPCPGLAAPGEL